MFWRSSKSEEPEKARAPAEGTLADAEAAAARGDTETALEIWSRLAHAGSVRAQAEIGRSFVEARGVERNPELAEKWLTLSAQGNDPLGQRLLADFHFNGEKGAPNRSIAEEWYARAARQGESYAQDMLSWMLTESDHRKPDYAEARQWALKAAEQGVPSAMTRLGLMYHNALGVERDAEAAATWWRKAALLDDADAQAMLGAAYHIGAGVPRDAVSALAWLTRAHRAHSKFADRFFVAIRDSCTDDEREEAERRADEPLFSVGGAS
jgi:TPR repeat protein